VLVNRGVSWFIEPLKGAGGQQRPREFIHVLDLSTDSSTASDIAAARQADQIAFLHRVPFTLDAYKLGFLPGFREDCGYQETQYQNLSIPCWNARQRLPESRSERFVDRFFEYEPEVGVIGDVDEIDDVDAHVAAARGSKRAILRPSSSSFRSRGR